MSDTTNQFRVGDVVRGRNAVERMIEGVVTGMTASGRTLFLDTGALSVPISVPLYDAELVYRPPTRAEHEALVKRETIAVAALKRIEVYGQSSIDRRNWAQKALAEIEALEAKC